jgi:hypothetical protein
VAEEESKSSHELLSAWFARLWRDDEDQDAVRQKEDDEIIEQLVRRVKKSTDNEDSRRARLGFTHHCYGKRLGTYRRAGARWRSATFLLGLTLGLLGAAGAVSGALGKGVGKGSGWSIAAIVTGSLVTVLTGLSRTWKPEEQYEHFHLTRALLRKEGWDYVQEIGAYKKTAGKTVDADAAYVLFADRIGELLHPRSSKSQARSRG